MSDAALAAALEAHDLFHVGDGGLLRVPHLVRGRLVAPPPVTAGEARRVLGDADYARLLGSSGRAGAQLLRERLFDRDAMRAADGDRVLVLPDVAPEDVADPAPASTREALARLPLAASLAFLDAAAERLRPDGPLGARLRGLLAPTSDLPDLLLDTALTTIAAMFREAAVRAVLDAELALGGVPGSHLVDGWVAVDAPVWDGPTRELLRRAHPDRGDRGPAAAATVRAMPTLQLHVTAGNSPLVAPTSALRALAAKCGAIVKLPAGAVLPGAALALALADAGRAHRGAGALLDATSLVYWRGGDARVEDALYDRERLDRVVVWGAPEAVSRVGGLAARSGVRTVVFEPRYGVSLVGREAFASDAALAATARRAAADTLIWNQRACIASLVHYVEGDAAASSRYAAAVRDALAELTELAPPAPSRSDLGAVQRLRRGKLIGAPFLTVGAGRDLRAAVVEAPGPFELMDHPLARLVVVRRVDHLEDAVAHCHKGVSTAGVYPEPRRLALREALAARGVSNVLPLGACERGWPGMPHDGARVLAELVEWVNG